MPVTFDLDCKAEDVIRLTEAELRNPVSVFRSFFADHSMGDIRSHFNEMLETCLTTENPSFKTAASRNKLITIHRGMERFFEAGLICVRTKAAQADDLEHLE